MPKVSVIVPVYNVQPYISKCLDSLHAQTISDIEFILVDDCGTDRSMDIARQYATLDSRFRILEGSSNQGVACARNRGMAIARGEYIGFVDSDDWINPDFYQKLYEKAVDDKADVVKGTIYFVHGQKYEKCLDNDSIRRCLRYKRWVGLSYNRNFVVSIYRASILKQYAISFPELKNGEDCVFHINCMLHVNKLSIVENAYYFYLQRESSAVHSIRELTYSTWFGHPEIVAKMLNVSALPKRDLFEGWHRLVMGCLLSKRIPSCMNNDKNTYIEYVARVKNIFLSSGYADELYSRYPSRIYYDLLRKSPEKIVEERNDILPQLERPSEQIIKFLLDVILRIIRREFTWRYGDFSSICIKVCNLIRRKYLSN